MNSLTRKSSSRQVIFPAIVLLVFFIFQILLGQHLVENLPAPSKNFDYKYVVEYAKSFTWDLKVTYSFPNQILDYPYIYGFSVLPVFKFSGLIAIPPIVFIFFTFSIINLFLSVTIGDSIIARAGLMLLLLSPPICLLFERANIDLLIAVLIILASWFFSKSYVNVGIIILALASLFKFYLLPAFILFGLYRWRRSIFGIAFTLLMSFLTVLNYVLIDRTFFPSSWESSFGPEALGSVLTMIGVVHPTLASWSVSFLIFIFVSCAAYKYITQIPRTQITIGFFVFIVSSLTFSLSSLLITSYSYRLFLVVLAYPFVTSALKGTITLNIYYILALIGFFMSNPRGIGIHEIHLVLVAIVISDVCLLCLAGIHFGLLLRQKNLLPNYLSNQQ